MVLGIIVHNVKICIYHLGIGELLQVVCKSDWCTGWCETIPLPLGLL